VRLTHSLTAATLARVLASLALLFAVAMVVSLYFLGQSFDRLERREAVNAAARATLLVAQQSKSVGDSARDYGQWNEAADYLAGKVPSFEAFNFTIDSFRNLDIDALLVLRPGGTVVFQGARPGAFGTPPASRPDGLSDFPPAVLAQWESFRALHALRRADEATFGFLETGGVPAIVGVTPVLNADGSGPCRGVLVMIRLLGPERLSVLSSLTQADLQIHFAPTAEDPFPGEPEVEVGQTAWRAARRLPGLLGGPTARIEVSGEPLFRAQRQRTAWVLGADFALTGLACALLVALALHRGVLGRLADFSRRAVAMRSDRAAAMRMPVRGGDELDRLATAINELLDELQQVQDRLSFDALHDSLTGLANRALLMERLAFAQAMAARDESHRYAVLLMDLDGFKTVNDLYSHLAGDALLRTVTERLRGAIRGIDTVARLGGDEFVIVLSEAGSVEDCEKFCRRVLSVVAEPVRWEGRVLQVTASIGLVHSDRIPPHARPGDLLRDADIAMYQAKEAGRNRHTVFDSAMRDHVSQRHGLEQEFRGALREGGLTLHFQPIVAARTGRIESVEALVRWPHPQRGMLTPGTFVPMAEEAGLVADLDAWVLPRALEAVGRLRKLAPDLAVSVNISVARLLQPDLPQTVAAALGAAGVPGGGLRLELTETGFTRSEGLLVEAMTALLGLGVEVHLDDFGTGYSSLNRLHALPVRVLKLDRFFVSKVGLGYESVVSGIVGVAHALGKSVVAEGVETVGEYRELGGLGCEFFQGYYFARPMPEEELADLLRTNPRWEPNAPRPPLP